MKKFLSFLSVLMLTIFVSVFSVACGDKYKNMYLEVQYLEWAKTEEGGVMYGEWKTIDVNPNSENYGLSFMLNDFYKNKDDDYYELKMRVLVKGTKKKVDHITIACPEGELSDRFVTSGQEFVLRFSNTASPHFYAVPSIKSDSAKVDFPIVIYSELDHIEANSSYYPAIAKGSTLMLNELTDMIVYVGKDGADTNQKGVLYSIEGNGVKFENGVYTIGNASSNDYFSLDTNNNVNKITVGSGFANGSVTVKATSVYYDYLTGMVEDPAELQKRKDQLVTNIDVKIVDNISSGSVNLNYINDYNSENDGDNYAKKVETISLYKDSEKYAETTLVLSGGVTNDTAYKFGVAQEDVCYDVAVQIYDSEKGYYVNMEDYNYEHRGVRVTNITEDNTNKSKKYIIGLYEFSGISENKLRFVVGFDNLRFTGKDYSLTNSVLKYDLKIERADLPNAIFINGNAYQNGQELTGVIYDKYSSKEKGYQLNINAVREVQKQTEIEMSIAYSGAKGDDAENYHKVGAFYYNDVAVQGVLYDLTNKIYLKFVPEEGKQYPSQVHVSFKVLASPLTFEGKDVTIKDYITVELILTVSGSLKDVSSTDKDENDNKLFGENPTKLIEANKNYETKIILNSNGGVNVATETVSISSEGSLIELSADGRTWVKTIKFSQLTDSTLFIKAGNNVTSKLMVVVNNGEIFYSTDIQFVETVGGNIPRLTFDETYIFNAYRFGCGDDFSSDYFNGKNGYYLAMQLGVDADFLLTYGNGKTAGIFNTVPSKLTKNELEGTLGKTIPAYALDCVELTTFTNGYSFNIKTRNKDVAVVLRVDYQYYAGTGDGIQIVSDCVYLEIAVYVPVNDLSLETVNAEGKSVSNEIYYVNELLTDKASVTITTDVNSTASKNIYFSNEDLNNKLNVDTNNNSGYIFNISVSHDTYTGLETSGNVESLTYIDLTKSAYTLTLSKNILAQDKDELELNIKFEVQQFGKTYTRTFTKKIKIIKHIKVENINVTRTNDYNVYLSYLSNESKTSTFGAVVSNLNATYPNLEYLIYKFDENKPNNIDREKPISPDDSIFSVNIDNYSHQVTLGIKNLASKEGGVYVLRIVAPDSFDDEQRDYMLCKYVVVNISNGSKSSPYYLRTPDDVKAIKDNAESHFVLASNIDLSTIDGCVAEEFSGSLDGLIRIYNSNTNTNMYSQFKFTNLTITNGFKTDGAYNYGLFGVLSGTIKNVIIENVRFNDIEDGKLKDFNLTGGASNNDANIGALAGINKGTIINSSVSVLESCVTVSGATFKNINIGSLVGENQGIINYYDESNIADKKYALVIQSAIYNGEFVINVESVGNNTNINFGGLIGSNAVGSNAKVAELNANYFDYEESLFKEYLTASVNMWLNINSYISNSYLGSVGGIVGANSGKINNVCVTGEVKASGNNISAGGVVGWNDGTLENSASYTTKVSGGAYTKDGSTQEQINSQYVGGLVGRHTGSIESVDVVYVDLAGTGFDTPYQASINGVCVVGGLVGYAESGTITNGNVQSFVAGPIIKGLFTSNRTEQEYGLLGGLIGKNSATVDTCFVSADIESRDAKTFNTIATGSVSNCYYVGHVRIYKDGKIQVLNGTEDLIIENSSSSIYSFVFGYETTENDVNYEYAMLWFNEETAGYYYPEENCWISGLGVFNDNVINDDEKTTAPTLLSTAPWSTNPSYITYNYGLPVLTYGDKHTMIALPEELYANVSKEEFEDSKDDVELSINENGIFISDGATNGNNTAIVFLNNKKTYNLVSMYGEMALINKTVSPVIASGQYYVKTVSGGDCFILVGNSIKFTKVGRIELEFISLFNPEAKDTVVIYVENPIDNFEILNGGKVIEKLSTYTNVNKLLEFNALFNNLESVIDTSKLLLKFEIEDVSTDVIKINSLVNRENADGYYSFNDLGLEIGNITNSKEIYELKTSLYLDLSKYYLYKNGNEKVTYKDVFGIDTILLNEKTINIDIYQSANSLTIDTAEQNLPTSKDSFIKFDIVTSYIDVNVGNLSLEPSGNDLVATVKDDAGNNVATESFRCKIFANHAEDWLETFNLNSLWELFDYSCYYSVIEGNIGYSYTFYFELKDEYKAITRNEVFEFKFSALSNSSATDTTTVTYTPQTIRNLRVENFKSGVVTSVAGGIVEYVSSETHSSIIVPGKNGLIKIFVEPEYASVDMLEISSNEILVNGVAHRVRFQQMLYDTREGKGFYVSYPGYTTENNTLKLQKNSYIDSDGNLKYNGVIYVRTILEKLVGVSKTFEITVKAHTYVRDEDGNYDKVNPVIDETRTRVTTKLLQTNYNPGVELSITNSIAKTIGSGATETTVNLVEKNSNNIVVYASIHGYHINQQPLLTFSWYGTDKTENIYRYVNYEIGSATKQTDGSYLLPVYLTTKNLSAPFKMSMTLTLISEGISDTSEERELIFYPVDYIPTGVFLKDSGNNYATLDVNSSMYFDFVWQSASQEINSGLINAELFTMDEANENSKLDYLYTISYDNGGQLVENYLTIGDFTTYRISADFNAKRYVITALGEGAINITFYARYDYIYDDVSGAFRLKFYSTRNESSGDYSFRYNFTIRFNIATTEETAAPIWTAEQFRTKLTAGGNFILMDNITLTDWVPLEANFASLDGNGKVIKIVNLSVPSNSSVSAGLFSVVSQNTILKNVVVDISSCEKTIMLSDGNNITGDTFFGFIAGVNNGIIYNSEVISITNSVRTITINTSSEKSYVGLFVGQNKGIITNSRVGTPYFETITVDKNGSTTSQVQKTGIFTVTARGIVAGFVAENSGTISSSYFNNANLINTHIVGNDDVNMTAGFVARNTSSGTILSSYAKGDGISSSSVRGANTGVINSGAGSAAGFVFENLGLIENSYSNLNVESSSFGAAGFVYENASTGVIKQSYSASKVTSNYDSMSTGVSLAVQLPFVGVDITNHLQSYGVLENCYYLELENDYYDTKFLFTADMDMPIALNKTNFSISDSLINFAFVEGNYSQNIQGIWTYHATLDKNDQETYMLGKTTLPELTSANQIARSIRYVEEKVAEDGEIEHVLIYANGYNQGSAQNPYIIRDYNEYNKVFNYNKEDTRFNGFTGYVRLINNIDFTLSNNNTATINTTLGFVLGDKTNKTLTVFDGNGMTISGVNTKNNEVEEQNSLGLFNEIDYSIVKNVKIEFIKMEYSSTRSIYSGGLAGKIEDSHIIGIELVGNQTTISAYNFAGGLAGIITGKSGIYNVESNLSVKVGKEGLTKYYQYISKDKFMSNYSGLGYNFTYADNDRDGDVDDEDKYIQYLNQLSYAGGLVGVIDYDTTGEYAGTYNLNKVTIGKNSTTSVVADVSGFVAGYIGRGVSSNRLKAVINNNSFVEGSYIVGGLIGENYGVVRYSQVSYLDSSAYDNTFKAYILDKNVSAITNTGMAYGTLEFVRSNSFVDNYKTVAGGLIGVNYGGQVDNSYTKANITANANYVGGLIGVNYGGMINSVYAQNYIDLSTLQNVAEENDRTERVGGLIAVNAKTADDNLSKIYKINNFNGIDQKLKADTVVVATFFDKTQLVNRYETIDQEREISSSQRKAKKVKVDYLVAEFAPNKENSITSAQGENIAPRYVYYLSYGIMDQSNAESTTKCKDYIYFTDYINKNIENVVNIDEKTDKIEIWNSLITTANNDKIQHISEDITHLYDLTYEKQEEVFTKLFLTFDITMWDKDNTKYFPTLKDNPTINFYEINTEADLLLMVLHPDANFVLNGDLDLNATEYINYVLDITFTGMLVGRVDANGKAPTIRGIKLCTDGKYDTAGFFKQTGEKDGNGAIINNVNFEYNYFVADNSQDKNEDTNITIVGLLTPQDYNSGISGVNVTVAGKGNITYTLPNSPSSTTINLKNVNNCRIVTNPAKNATITTFGGLIGEANGTNLINSGADLDVCLTASNIDTANFGGAIGKSFQGTINSTVVMNCDFAGELYLNEYDNVGGIIGHANSASITGGTTNLIIDNYCTSTYYMGGVIGTQSKSYVEDTLSVLTVENGKNPRQYTAKEIDNISHNIGGVSGFVENYLTEEPSVLGAMATVIAGDASGEKLFSENVGMIAIGGVYGATSGYAKIQDCVTWSYGSVAGAETVLFGGMIGNAYETDLVKIDNSFAYLEGSGKTPGLKLSATGGENAGVKVGGLIASISSGTKDTVVEITNSSTSGTVWAETSNTGVGLTAGGLIGEWIKDGKVNLTASIIDDSSESEEPANPEQPEVSQKTLYSTKIENCYTTLMIETSKLKHTTSNIYNVSAIIGKISEYDSKIESSKLYYSSDFTLCLEEKPIFTEMPIDLVARGLLLDNQKKVFFGENNGWYIYGGGLPYRTSLTTKLSTINNGTESLYARYTNSNGYSLNPIRFANIVTNTYTHDFGDEFKYYFVYNYSSFAVSGSFSGVILGGGNEVVYSRKDISNSLTLNDHSVLSNLKVTIKTEQMKAIIENEKTEKKEFSFVSENNGTMFNIYLDYFYKPDKEIKKGITSGGGMVGTNKGSILYCFNSGNIEEVIGCEFAGIATTNNGYIAHSAFVGTLTGYSQTAGISYINEGSIFNSYSAGVLERGNTLLNKDKIGGVATLENCYYDMYANMENQELKDINDKYLIKPVGTNELQNGTSGLIGEWKSYPISNPTIQGEVTIQEMSYNYGYPIYNLKQMHVVEGEPKEYLFKGLETGDGTEEKPFLFNNLGTLQEINNNTISSAGRSFVLVNDVDGLKNDEVVLNWEGIKDFAGNFTTGDRVKRVVAKQEEKPEGSTKASGKEESKVELVTVRVIDNLVGSSGLFNTLSKGANISMVAFRDVEIKNGGNAGALANTVALPKNSSVSTVEEAGAETPEGTPDGEPDVNIAGIFLNADTVVSDMAITATNVGGLIGKITGDKGTVSIKNINKLDTSKFELDVVGSGFDPEKVKFDLFSTDNCTNMGSVVGAIDGKATIVIKNVIFNAESNIGQQVTDGKTSYSGNSGNVGGLIGSIKDANVKINSVEINAVGKEPEFGGQIVGTGNVGGLIGVNGGSTEFSLNNKDVLNLSIGNELQRPENAGGLIGANGHESMSDEVEYGFTLSANSTSTVIVKNIFAKINGGGLVGINYYSKFKLNEKLDVEVESISANEGSAGGLVGTCYGGEIGYKETDELSPITVKKLVASSAGGVVGTMSAGTIAGFAVELEGSEYNCNQFGGVVGCASSGKIGDNKGKEKYPITIEGNVVLTECNQAGAIVGLIQNESNAEFGSIQSFTLEEVESSLNITVQKDKGADSVGLGGIAGCVVKSEGEGIIPFNIKFNNIELDGNLLDGQNGFENVGGLFGDLRVQNLKALKDGVITISNLQVLGTNNVGGFAGKYESTDILIVNEAFDKYLTGEPIGIVGISQAETATADAYNFGGLFGLYKSSKLAFELRSSSETDSDVEVVTDEELIEKWFVNKNNILTELNSKAFTLLGSGGKKYKINNVGGIAGSFIPYGNGLDNIVLKGENNGTIGMSYEDPDNGKYYSKLQDSEFKTTKIQSEILNMNNVGGIVGSIGSSSLTVEVKGVKNTGTIKGYQYVGGILGIIANSDVSKEVNNAGITIVSAVVEGQVLGHSYLGGIAGSIGDAISWSALDGDDVSINSNLSGYGYIGSFAGKVEGVKTISKDLNKIGSFTSSSSITGLINIGGVVGYVSGVETEDASATMVIDGGSKEIEGKKGSYTYHISGNTNVGGLVGYAKDNVEIQNFGKTKVDIKVLDYKIGPDTNAYGKKVAYYRPTSVGGIVGYAKNKIVLENNVSAGYINSDSIEENLSVNNYVVNSGEITYSNMGKYNGSDYVSDKELINDYKSYNSIKSGIGGVIGTAGTGVNVAKQEPLVNINAPTGFNVGGIAGYWYVPKDENGKTEINLSNYNSGDGEAVYIAGGMGVGALFGYLESENEIICVDKASWTNSHSIYLQSALNEEDSSVKSVYGKYVGGIIGKSSSITGLSISVDANVKIDNSQGSAYGGLIGCLIGSLKSASNTTEPNSGNNLFKKETNYNYGGLVGLLRAGASEVSVYGEHYYPFTVDTLHTTENVVGDQQYFEYSSYSKEGGTSIGLHQFVYNTSNISISASQAFKNGDINHNPTINLADYKNGSKEKTGWDAPYTMFRLGLSSYVGYEKSEAYKRTGEVSTVVYNAKYVKYVDPNKLVLYGADGEERLYSKYGIATPIAQKNNQELENYYVNNYDSMVSSTIGYNPDDIKEILNRGKFKVNLSRYVTQGEDEFIPISSDQFAKYETFTEEEYGFQYFRVIPLFRDFVVAYSKSEIVESYIEIIRENLRFKIPIVQLVRTINGKTVYDFYKVDTIFCEFDDTLYDDDNDFEDYLKTGAVSSITLTDKDAEDFSLFTIKGNIQNRHINVNFAFDRINIGELIFAIISSIVAFIASIVLVYNLGAIFKGLKIGIKVVKLLKTILVAGSVLGTAYCGITAYNIFAYKTYMYVERLGTLNNVFYEYEGDYGHLASIYSLDWIFKTGYMTGADSQTKDSAGIPYYYYSSTRPIDYGTTFTFLDDEMKEKLNITTEEEERAFVDAANLALGVEGEGVKAGKKYHKYLEEDGEYFINSLWIKDIDVQFVEGYRPVTEDYWWEEKDGKIYVLDNNTVINSKDGMDYLNTIKDKSITKQLNFKYVKESEGELIKGVGKVDLNYKLVTSGYGEHAIEVWVKGDDIKFDGPVDGYEKKYYVPYDKNGFLFKESEFTRKGSFLKEKGATVSGVIILTATLDDHCDEESSIYTDDKNYKFVLYNHLIPKGYALSSNDDGTLKEYFALKRLTKKELYETPLYDAFGNKVLITEDSDDYSALKEKYNWSVIESAEDLKKYYLANITTIGEGEEKEDYKISALYRFYNDEIYILQIKYGVKSSEADELYGLTTVTPLYGEDSLAEYSTSYFENKYELNLAPGATILTRYWYGSDMAKILVDELKVPTSSNGSYVFNESALYSYNYLEEEGKSLVCLESDGTEYNSGSK